MGVISLSRLELLGLAEIAWTAVFHPKFDSDYPLQESEARINAELFDTLLGIPRTGSEDQSGWESLARRVEDAARGGDRRSGGWAGAGIEARGGVVRRCGEGSFEKHGLNGRQRPLPAVAAR